jgi:hypothetical protein
MVQTLGAPAIPVAKSATTETEKEEDKHETMKHKQVFAK